MARLCWCSSGHAINTPFVAWQDGFSRAEFLQQRIRATLA